MVGVVFPPLCTTSTRESSLGSMCDVASGVNGDALWMSTGKPRRAVRVSGEQKHLRWLRETSAISCPGCERRVEGKCHVGRVKETTCIIRDYEENISEGEAVKLLRRSAGGTSFT